MVQRILADEYCENHTTVIAADNEVEEGSYGRAR
jgi:hypothetical protein